MKKRIMLILILLMPFSAYSTVKVERKTKFYDISPTSKKDIEVELKKNSPIIKNGKKIYGDTKWEIDTSYTYKGSCRITKVKVDLDIKTILPRLNTTKNVRFSVKSPFNKFYRKLAKYQKKHESFAIKAANEIEKKFLSYGSPEDCDKFRKTLRIDKNKIIKKYMNKSRTYDNKTNFGQKKGVKI